MNPPSFSEKLEKWPNFWTLTLIILWIIGILTAYFVLSAIWKKPDDTEKLIAAFAILLSAFMASVAMMKSMDNTNKIERTKKKRDLFEDNIRIYEITSTYLIRVLQGQKILLEDILGYTDESERSNFLSSEMVKDLRRSIKEKSFELLQLQNDITQLETIIKRMEEGFSYAYKVDEDQDPDEQGAKQLKKAEEERPLKYEKYTNDYQQKNKERNDILHWFSSAHRDLSETFREDIHLK